MDNRVVERQNKSRCYKEGVSCVPSHEYGSITSIKSVYGLNCLLEESLAVQEICQNRKVSTYVCLRRLTWVESFRFFRFIESHFNRAYLIIQRYFQYTAKLVRACSQLFYN